MRTNTLFPFPFTVGICLWSLLAAGPAGAFSPYENYLLSGRDTHVGLIAQAKVGKVALLAGALQALQTEEAKQALALSGIRNLAAFKREIHGADWFLIYFCYEGGRAYLGAAEAFETAAPVTQSLADLVAPHPRAKRYGRQWLQMEWINYIRGKDVEGNPSQVLSMVTMVKPEKEAEYRTLHQTVWPGVVDQMVRGNNRNFSIFLMELDDELYEFFYLEYMGADSAQDDAANRADPINQRWWKYTDACQRPLPGVEGIWAPMQLITSQ